MKRKGISFPLIVSALLGGVVLSSCGKNNETQQDDLVVLKRIEIQGTPKTEYFVGDTLEKPTVIAYYSNGTTADVTNDSDCKFLPVNALQTPGQKTISVTYGGKGTSYTINVSSVSIASIKVGNDTKTEYEYGEPFVSPKVYAVRTNGTEVEVTNDASINSDEFNPNLSGTYEIKISYSSVPYECSYNVTVKAPTNTLQKIEIVGTYKTEYNVNDTLVKPTIKATFLQGEAVVTDDCVFEYDFSEGGEKTVTVKYKQDRIEKEISYTVNVISINSKLKFAVFADVQLCNNVAIQNEAAANLGETANAPLALEQHLKYVNSQDIDVILMNGDITNQANEHYYDHFESIVEKVYGSEKSEWPEFVWNMGNHEWWGGTTEDDPRTGTPGSYTLENDAINSVKLFNEHARIESSNLQGRSEIKYATNVEDTLPSYYKVINGVPFLVISAVNSSGLITAELKAEINSWLSEINNLESVQAGGPIFVEYHYPIGTSMTHGQGSHQQNTDTIDEIFGDIPNAIIFTGDTHFPGNNERSINQTNYTTINLGTSSYSRMVDESAVICSDFENVTGGNKGDGRGEIAQGDAGYKNAYTPNIQIVEVYDNNSTKIQRKMSNPDGTARKVGEDWVIPAITSKSDFTYTDARFQETSSAQKLYGKNGVSWEETDKVTFGVNKTTKQMTVQFKDPIEHNFVEHFDINVNGEDHYFVSNYYKYPEDRQQNYFVIENLTLADNYDVEVTAYDFYDNPSLNKLTSSTKNDAKCIDPVDFYFADGNYNYSDIETRNNFEITAEGSNSSTEFYYRGIQTHNAGAILGRLINNNLKVSDYLSLPEGDGSEPVVKFDVKNLKSDELAFGLSVVTNKPEGGEKWHTDFGTEYQKAVSGTEWTSLSWNLKDLFGITSKEAIKNITIKAKSKSATTNGYEMNFLVDNIDITNGGDEPTPPTPSTNRGDAFNLTDGLVKDFDSISTTDGTFIMDIKPTTGTDKKVCFGLFDSNWTNRVGWFDVLMDGSPVCDGITVRSTNDGYLRIKVDFAQLPADKFEPGHATEVSHLQIHNTVEEGSWTTASGYVDVFPTQGTIIRGQRFQNETDLTIALPEHITLDSTIKVDVKFDEPVKTNKAAIMLGQGWNQYFGYFIIQGDGTLESDYNGVTIANLDDGYIRATFDLSNVTKVEDQPAPDEYIDMIYVRGGWSKGNGYIDINSNEGRVVRGDTYVAGQHFDRNIGDHPLTETFSFDVLFTSGAETYINVMLGDGWSNYFGYYKILGNGTLSKAYAGVSISTLGDGYYRVTFDLSLLNEKNGNTVLPTEKVNLFYIRGDEWSTANCYIDLEPSI